MVRFILLFLLLWFVWEKGGFDEGIEVAGVDKARDMPIVSLKQTPAPHFAGGIFGVEIGDVSAKVIETLGEPSRKEQSALGYEWWIYNRDLARYVQVGIDRGVVVDLYSNAPSVSFQGAVPAIAFNQLSRLFSFPDHVTFHVDGAMMSFENADDGQKLARVKDYAAIFFLDQLKNRQLRAIRLLDPLVLAKARLYTLEYQYVGKEPDVEAKALSAQQLQQAERAFERQLFDLANVTRLVHGLSLLEWNGQAANVARAHSDDMKANRYFAHVSKTTGLDLAGRLQKAGVSFRYAGENIAMGTFDAVMTHEAWLNSAGHRENILNPHFTTLGVGVAGKYYTQNFVTP